MKETNTNIKKKHTLVSPNLPKNLEGIFDQSMNLELDDIVSESEKDSNSDEDDYFDNEKKKKKQKQRLTQMPSVYSRLSSSVSQRP